MPFVSDESQTKMAIHVVSAGIHFHAFTVQTIFLRKHNIIYDVEIAIAVQ